VCEVAAGAMQDFLEAEADFPADLVGFLFLVGKEVGAAGVDVLTPEEEELCTTTAVDAWA
jgi:hypothetical protein